MTALERRKGLRRLLIVDGDSGQRRTLTDVFRVEGFDVIGCSTSAEALKLIDKSEAGIVLAESHLPDCEETRLLGEIQRLNDSIRVIAYAGQDVDSSDDQPAKGGTSAYLDNTNSIDELVRSVRRAASSGARETDPQDRRGYEHVVDQLADTLIVHDQEGRILDVNQHACKSLGYTRGELLDMSVWDVETVFSQSELQARWEQRAVGVPLTCEGRLRRGDGVEFPVEVRTVLIELDGQLLFHALARDITERVQTQEALRKSRQQLEETLEKLKESQEQIIQQERLRALGQMASGIAHDLNNSLSPVLGYAELVGSTPNLPEDIRQAMIHIQTGARDAAAVVARLREFYRVQPTGGDAMHEAVPLAGVLRQIRELTRPKWRDEAQRTGRSIDFRLELQDEVTARGNPAELREVFTNLVFNAVDAMPSGGQVTLSLQAVDGHAVVAISDTGIGMTSEVASRCFEPFFTTSKPQGTGLGLSVCHGIIQRHKGKIEIETDPGCGATFRVYLPLAGEFQAAAIEEDDSPPLPNARVLYIDDDSRLRRLAATLFERLGLEADLAQGGAEGLSLLKANHYDVVVTDLGMPHIDGREVTRLVKSIRVGTPVIMVTGWGSGFVSEDDFSDDAPDHWVAKPLTESKLRKVLGEVLTSPRSD